MIKRVLVKTLIILIALPVVLFICSLIYSYYLFSTEPGVDIKIPRSLGHFGEMGNSKFDPKTILESVKRGEAEDLFQVESGYPEDPQLIAPNEWTQAEFLEVVTAVSQAVWKETLDDWNLYLMKYFSTCRNNPDGFSNAEFYFYKEVTVGESRMYSVRGIEIDPEYGYVIWGTGTWDPPFWGMWKIINLDQITVPVEDALMKAESDGGMGFRESVEYECKIWASMSPEIIHVPDWKILYESVLNDGINRVGRLYWIPPK